MVAVGEGKGIGMEKDGEGSLTAQGTLAYGGWNATRGGLNG